MDAQTEKYNQMMYTPMVKLIMMLSVSTISSQLVSTVYNMVDTFFVAQLGTSVTAAVGVVNSLQSLIQAVGYGIGMGCGALIARSLGRQDTEKSNLYGTSGLLMASVSGIIILVVGYPFISRMMSLLGASDSMLEYAIDYGRIILLAAPIMCISFTSIGVVRYSGFLKLSMIGSITGCICNGLMDPVLIFGCKLGVAGAALSTLLAEAISCTISLYFLFGHKTSLTISKRYISKDKADYFRIIKSGVPTIFRQMMGSFSSALLNNIARPFGDSAVAAVTISNKIYALVRNMVLGVGQAMQPVVGFCYGANNKKRVKKAFWVAVWYGTFLCLIIGLFLYFKAEFVVSLFQKNDPEVVLIGAQGLRYCCYVLLFLSFSTFVNQVFQVLGFAAPASLLASCRQGICFVPIILILPKVIGVAGVEMAQAVSDLATAIISLPFWFWMNRYLSQETV